MQLAKAIFLALVAAECHCAGELYFTNGTCVFRAATLGGRSVVPLTCSAKRAVGLAADLDFLFWSDVEDGSLYRMHLTNTSDIKRIVAGLETVNGLAIDRVNRLLYWTDEGAQLIELATYDGTKRTIIVNFDLEKPRGLLVDPSAGYVYWNDQGKGTLERCRLDGSERETLVRRYSLLWPNQMAFGLPGEDGLQTIYFADGFTGRVHTYNDRSRSANASTTRLSAENATLFGLALDTANHKMYASDWAGHIYELSGSISGRPGSASAGVTSTSVLVAGYSQIFSLALQGRVVTPIQTACSVGNGGCSHLCLQNDKASLMTRRCACPSYEGLSLDAAGKACREPENVLVYAAAGSGQVNFQDLGGWIASRDAYVVARSSRPVAVAYDPLNKIVFWSDGEDRFIASARLNGSGRRDLVRAGRVGFVDGLAYDYVMGNLYFTNAGEVDSAGENRTFSWRTVELVNTKTLARRVVLSILKKPRAIAIDYETGYLYVSDSGAAPGVVRCGMDGSNPTALSIARVPWRNPNALVLHNGFLYVLDANAGGAAPTLTKIHIHQRNLDYSDIALPAGIPYGMAVKDDHALFVSDMKSSSIHLVNIGELDSSNVSSWTPNVAEPMAMAYVDNSEAIAKEEAVPAVAAATTAVPASGATPSEVCHGYDICVKNDKHLTVGLCANVDTASVSKVNGACSVPEHFLLVADLTSIRIIDVMTQEQGILFAPDPLASNIVGVAYDNRSGSVFYSDAEEGSIYVVTLAKPSDPRLFFADNGSIDGLVFDSASSTLYWTVSTGLRATSYIAAAGLEPGGRSGGYAVVAGNLLQPRGLAVAGDTLYWTERGRSPRVQYKRFPDRSSAKMYNVRRAGGHVGLSSPNSISVIEKKTLIGDFNEIVTCVRYGSDSECSGVPVAHVFGLAVSGNGSTVYYADWNNSRVASIDEAGVTRTLIEGCVRPAMIALAQRTTDRSKPTAQTPAGIPGWIYLTAAVGALVIAAIVVALTILYRRMRRSPLRHLNMGTDAYSMADCQTLKTDTVSGRSEPNCYDNPLS